MREGSKCDEYILGGISALICLDCVVFGIRARLRHRCDEHGVYICVCEPKTQSCSRAHGGSGCVNK